MALGALAVWVAPGLAAADVLPPLTPECPEGSVARKDHSGIYCEPTTCDPDQEKVLDVGKSSMHLLSEVGSAFESCLSLHPDDDLVLADAAAQIKGAPVLHFFLWVFFI